MQLTMRMGRLMELPVIVKVLTIAVLVRLVASNPYQKDRD